MFSVRSEIVITGVGMNSLCNFTKYYSCEISLNVNFDKPSDNFVQFWALPGPLCSGACPFIVLGVKKKLFTLLIINNFSEDEYMVLKLSYYIAEMCTIYWHNFRSTIVFNFSVIIDSFQKSFSDFGHFEQLCEKNSCIDTAREHTRIHSP